VELLAGLWLAFALTVPVLAGWQDVRLPVPPGAQQVMIDPWSNAMLQYDSGFCRYPDGSGWTGELVAPSSGQIVERFRPFHSGTAWAGGDAVTASAAGIVIWRGDSTSGLGRFVALAHGDGWQTFYAYLERVEALRCGQRIEVGQIIGRSAAVQLIVRQHNVAYNPEWLLPLPQLRHEMR
jgi:murein DD-endopeptidase MepM/ murein hydrolase activator NlpD